MEYAVEILERELRQIDKFVKSSPKLQQNIREGRIYLQKMSEIRQALKVIKSKMRP
ncbi:MAG: hypothetical protein RMM53_12720 [Bacteroidia bacterium]|nr:hypothetical protein [Bacteroidia bacterium]MDW8335069.1 hypothetical protein [Bacteroidia bacterium]